MSERPDTPGVRGGVPAAVLHQWRCRIGGGAASAAVLHRQRCRIGSGVEFRGTTEKWMAHLTAALTEYGREVHIAAETITVMPWATLEEG